MKMDETRDNYIKQKKTDSERQTWNAFSLMWRYLSFSLWDRKIEKGLFYNRTERYKGGRERGNRMDTS